MSKSSNNCAFAYIHVFQIILYPCTQFGGKSIILISYMIISLYLAKLRKAAGINPEFLLLFSILFY